MELKNSQTRQNLMRAFAGECQARNRYDMAAAVARKEGHEVVAKVFEYTARQEQAHASVFYSYLKSANGEVIMIDTAYPVNSYDTTSEHLSCAKENEYEEWEKVYTDFARIAKEEGFDEIATTFKLIADVEKTHGDRFDKYFNEIKNSTLYNEENETTWLCINCGAIVKGKDAPAICPICKKPRGYFAKNTGDLTVFN